MNKIVLTFLVFVAVLAMTEARSCSHKGNPCNEDRDEKSKNKSSSSSSSSSSSEEDDDKYNHDHGKQQDNSSSSSSSSSEEDVKDCDGDNETYHKKGKHHKGKSCN